MLKGIGIIGISQTGSGKTAAFLIPTLSKLMGKAKNLLALVLLLYLSKMLEEEEGFEITFYAADSLRVDDREWLTSLY